MADDSKYFVTRDNMLDVIHSIGLDMKGLTSPYSHPYDDERRAAPYVPKYHACRLAWARLKRGDDMLQVVKDLHKAMSGIEANGCSLLESALTGKFEWTQDQFTNLPDGIHRVTYKGDYYTVRSGDRLNLPSVHRHGNAYRDEADRKLEGAQEIANLMPNPCTRIIRPIPVS